MLSLDGNTAPYMQYAHARIRSIFRKGAAEGHRTDDGSTVAEGAHGAFTLADPAERRLALKLLQLPETVAQTAAECLPNLLCAYLYDLAGAFTGFYENCPVLASDEPVRSSRLALCGLTARTIRTVLGLLGIAAPERM
jgi:arginyl-tRNA synthetase